MTLIDRLRPSVPKLDFSGWQQRLNQNRPANVLESWVFIGFDFALILSMCFCFLIDDDFRDRVYYLYEHPDHDDHLCLYPHLIRRHPHTTRWLVYLFPKVRHIWHKYLRFSRALKALIPTYKSSPPMFGPSPKLAIMIHGAGEWAEEVKIPSGCIRIHYAPSFEDGRYQTDSEFEPMLAIDLPVTRAGVDLVPLYNKWGLESVAFIVDNDFRPIFKPVDSRVLSPAAAYDLSKNFTRPIRVFEPEVSKYTTTKRKLHYPLFVIGLFFVSLYRLGCGEPTDRVYMCNLYGHRYADIYQCLARWFSGLRMAIQAIFRVLFHFFYWAAVFLGAIIYCIFLFVQMVVKAIGWILLAAVAAPSWSLKKGIAILESISVQILDAFGFAFSLRWKTWVIAVPACWMLYLELHHMVVG